jgi:GNAT superfamily N-acetyltransferase
MTQAQASDLRVRLARPSELEWINARYAEIRFLPSTAADLMAIGELGDQRVGIGRVVPIDASTGELGGMYVLPAFRGHGIAKAIVRFLVERTDRTLLYCVPFASKSAIYEGLGFGRVENACAIPAKIREKLDWCGRTHEEPVRLLEMRTR